MGKANSKISAFLVVGATGVGKSTICEYMTNLNKVGFKYKHIDLDKYIGKRHKTTSQEYFMKHGHEKFYKESYAIIKKLYYNHIQKHDKTILLIDVGVGSIQNWNSINLTNEFCGILLTADAEYLYYREKCRLFNKDIGSFKYFNFNKEKEIIYNQCKIKIDVSYLEIKSICEVMHEKIRRFMNGVYF